MTGLGRLVALIADWLRARTPTTTELRLSALAKRDIGLLPEEELGGVFHERDDFLWRM
jgi:hypothetical protein